MNPDEIPQPAVVGEDDETEAFSGQFDVTKKNGVRLTIRFTFDYPKDEGMTLWQILRDFQIPDQSIFDHLMSTADGSFLARAAAMRRESTTDEEED